MNRHKYITKSILALVIPVIAALTFSSCGSDDPAGPGIESGPEAWWEIEATVSILRGVYDPGTSGAIAVGDGGMILRENEGGWISMDSHVTASLNAIFWSSGSDIWAVGNSGVIVNYDGISWNRADSVTTTDLNCIFGFPGGVIIAAGDDGTVIRYDGMSWSVMPTVFEDDIYGIWGT